MIIAIVAGILTFSKTFIFNILIAFFIYFFLVFKEKGNAINKVKTSIFSLLLIIMGLFCLGVFIGGDTLSEEQLDRVQVIFKVLDKDTDATTLTTNRSDLFKFAFDLIISNPILGYGYGTFTNIVGSESVHYGVSQGAHNLFLRIWGEGGIIALALYIIFLYKVLQRAFASKYLFLRFLSVGTITISIFYNLTNHNFLEDYMVNFVFSLAVTIPYISR